MHILSYLTVKLHTIRQQMTWESIRPYVGKCVFYIPYSNTSRPLSAVGKRACTGSLGVKLQLLIFPTLSMIDMRLLLAITPMYQVAQQPALRS